MFWILLLLAFSAGRTAGPPGRPKLDRPTPGGGKWTPTGYGSFGPFPYRTDYVPVSSPQNPWVLQVLFNVDVGEGPVCRSYAVGYKSQADLMAAVADVEANEQVRLDQMQGLLGGVVTPPTCDWNGAFGVLTE